MPAISTDARRSLAIPAAAAVLMSVAGCASRRATPVEAPIAKDSAVAPAQPQALLNLLRAAERELDHPVTAAIDAPAPPGVDAIVTTFIPKDDPAARAPLDEVIAKLSTRTPVSDKAEPEGRADALRHYVVGREKLLQGDAPGAITELKSATDLDPTAGEPWKELGEAQLAQGLRSEAMTSFRTAVAHGLESPRALELLGRWALDRSDNSEASRLLARANVAEPGRADPALERLILVELARALAQQGYILASRQAIERALTSPAQLSASTRYGAELGALFRRQGDLWREAGDANCRLGLFAEAVQTYQNAADLPSLDAKPVLPRIVYACMRSGRPCAAAAMILGEMSGGQGRLGDDDVALLRHVTRYGADRSLVSEAINSMNPGATRYPTIEREHALARVAVLTPDEGKRVLRAHLARFPADISAALDLINSESAPAGAASEAARAAMNHPESSREVAEALLRGRHDVGEIVASLARTSPRTAATLVTAYLDSKQGRPGQGLDAALSISPADSVGIAAAGAIVELSIEAGDIRNVEDALSRLGRSKDASAQRTRVRCLMLLQRYRAALDAAAPLVETPAPRIDDRINDLLAAGECAGALSLADEAERWTEQARALDPYDDRAASLLMVFFSADGARPDPTRLTQVVRRLRQAHPESRTLRLVRARELMRRSQASQAEVELRRLVEEEPGDAAPIELLAALWGERLKDNATGTDAARHWLAAQLLRRPQSGLLLGALATVEVAAGAPAQAEDRLRRALDSGAGPDVSRVLERLLRDQLSRGAEADDLTLKRLERRDRTISESIELADVCSRSKRETDAARALAAAARTDVDLTRDQARASLAILARIIPALVDSADTAGLADANRVFDRCLALRLELTPELHQRRLESLAASPDVGTERLLEAAHQCAKQFPQTRLGAYIVPLNILVKAGRRDIVADFVSRGATDSQSDATLYDEWFVSVARFGGATDAKILIDTSHAAGKLQSIVERIRRNAPQPAVRDWRAEAAYDLGNEFSAALKTREADSAYELALQYDPKHAWASNNLGYALADRGQDLERASRLLEQAYAQLPLEGSVIDSLAWLRYKQGVILDEIDPQTGLTNKRGALSLLQNAASTKRGQEDAIILDHLGDSLWLAGKKQDAERAWKAAGIQAEVQLQEIRQQIEQVEQARRALRDANPDRNIPERVQSSSEIDNRRVAESTRDKREAASAGKAVRVAPQIADPNPQPIANPGPDAAAKQAHD